MKGKFLPVIVMGGRPDAVWQLRRCRVAAVVTDSEFVILLGVRHRAGSPLRHVRCELETGHGGAHVAFVIAAYSGEQWWWLCWDALDRKLAQIEPCAAVDDLNHDDCLLPAHHTGAHSFEL